MDRIQSLKQSFLSFAGAIGLSAMILVASPSAQTEPPAPPAGWPADCAYKYSFGSGATLLRYCVTTAGNLIYLETGQGVEHIYNYTASAGTVAEGYALCADPSPAPWYQREYYDFYTYGGYYLWHPVLVSTDPLVIERTTIDNSFKLRQKFIPNPAEQELVVEMKLTNLLPVARTNVMLKRAVDFNVIPRDMTTCGITPTIQRGPGTGRAVLRYRSKASRRRFRRQSRTSRVWNGSGALPAIRAGPSLMDPGPAKRRGSSGSPWALSRRKRPRP